MPSSSSFCAMMSLSSTEKEMDSPCVPSRRVVSNVKIFISTSEAAGTEAYPPDLPNWHSDFFFLFEEGHHLAQAAAHHFDRLVARGLAHGQKLSTARLV